MCLRAQVPRQPPPGKMVRRGGDGRCRLGAMATDRRCVPREASRTLLPEAPRLPKTARTSGRAARSPAASCPPVSVQAPVLRKELVHPFPTPYPDETLSRLRLTGQRAVSQQRPKRLRARSERIGRLGPHEVARHPRNVAGSLHSRERSRDRTTERRSRRLTTPTPAAEVGLRYRLRLSHKSATTAVCCRSLQRPADMRASPTWNWRPGEAVGVTSAFLLEISPPPSTYATASAW
jgi:hypothetical protein